MVALWKNQPEVAINPIDQIKEVDQLVDTVASHLNIKVSDKQSILEAYDPKERLKKAFAFIEREISILNAQKLTNREGRNQETRMQR